MNCPCGHETHRAPTTRAEILECAALHTRLRELLEPVVLDSGKWMAVERCTRCGRLWAEDCLESGHASLFFSYPIETDDPAAWLASAQSIWA